MEGDGIAAAKVDHGLASRVIGDARKHVGTCGDTSPIDVGLDLKSVETQRTKLIGDDVITAIGGEAKPVITGTTEHRIVASAPIDRIVATIAVYQVIVFIAVEKVITATTEDRVVILPSEDDVVTSPTGNRVASMIAVKHVGAVPPIKHIGALALRTATVVAGLWAVILATEDGIRATIAQ